MITTRRVVDGIASKVFSKEPITSREFGIIKYELDKIENWIQSNQVTDDSELEDTDVCISKQFFLDSDDLIDINMDDIEFLRDSFILKCGANLLVSSQGVGKTLFSIFLAQSLNIKMPIFFLFEDYNNLQLNRYRQGLAGKDYKIITLQMWEDWCLQVKQNIEKVIEEEAMNHFNPMYKFFRQYNKVLRRLKAEKNILDDNKFDFVMCYMLFLEEYQDVIDFVVIDTFLGMQDGKRFHRNHLKRLIGSTLDKDITLLILHHTNAKNGVEGSNELERVVDYAYVLEKYDDESEGDKELLTLKSIKERYTPSISLMIEKTKKSTFVADFEVLGDVEPADKASQKGLQSILEDFFNSYDGSSIGKDELLEKLTNGHPDEINPGTLTNKLTNLKNKGVISMTVEGSWSNITIN